MTTLTMTKPANANDKAEITVAEIEAVFEDIYLRGYKAVFQDFADTVDDVIEGIDGTGRFVQFQPRPGLTDEERRLALARIIAFETIDATVSVME